MGMDRQEVRVKRESGHQVMHTTRGLTGSILNGDSTGACWQPSRLIHSRQNRSKLPLARELGLTDALKYSRAPAW